MNIYAIIILTTVLVGYVLEVVGEVLNLRSLRSGLPQEFREVYDAREYERNQEYTRVRTRFSLVHGVFDLAIFLGFWFLGGFDWLDGIVRGRELGEIPTGLLYILSLVVFKSILGLPFSIYSTFVVEERFGFNKTTPGTFIADRIKGLFLLVLLGAPLLATLLFLLGEAGDRAWIACWGLAFGFSLFLQFVFPTWILPLFNKLEPIEEGELKSAILEYARSVRFPIRNIFVMDGSRRSQKSNAFFSGFGSRKRLALFDTLVEKHPTAELVAVVAHEVGHYKRKHIPKSLILNALYMGLLFFVMGHFIGKPALFEAFYMKESSIYAGLILFSMLFSPIDLILSLALNAFSRKNEYEADRYAAETIQDPDEMAKALTRLSRDNLTNLTPHPFHTFLHASHPPIVERLAAIRKG